MAFPTPVVEAAFGAIPTASYTDQVAGGLPIVYWRLGESVGTTAADASGNSRPGTYTGTGVTYAQPGGLPGDADTAVTLDGAAGAISRAAMVGLPAAGWTIEVWVKRAGIGSVQKVRVQNGPQVGFELDDRLCIYSPGGSVLGSTAPVITDTNWHYVVATWDGTTALLYLDGAVVTTATPGAIGGGFSIDEAVQTLFVGRSAVGTNWFNGSLDEFAEYTTPLTAATIAARYQARLTNPTVTWTDITAYVLAGTVTRGRQHETDTIQGGTCTLTLDNIDGRFTAGNTASPYSPNVLPLVPVRVRFTYNAITYYAFAGYVERWPNQWSPPDAAVAQVTCVDGFEPLSLADVSGSSWGAEGTGARIAHALGAGLWTAGNRNLDTGLETVQASSFSTGSNTSALAHIQEVADTDGGYFFISADGKATFHDREHRARTASSAATFGDQADQLPYEDLTFDFSKDLIANDVTVTRTGGTPQRVQDSASQAAYFPRLLSRSGLHTTDAAALSQATDVVFHRRNPAVRVEQIALKPPAIGGADGDSLWAQILGREIGDMVTVVKTPRIGDAISRRVYIERISHAFNDVEWSTAWQLSPEAQSGYWVLDGADTLDVDAMYVGY